MFESLYNNIGQKIKKLAIVTFVADAIAAVIGGICCILSGEEGILIGLALIVLGPIAAWIATFILYAFGELVEKVCDMQESAERIEYLLEKESNGAIKENNVARASRYVPEKPKSAERIEYPLEKESNGAIKENNVARASAYVPEKPKSENDPRHKWLCSNCKKMRSETPCEHCGM